MKLHGKTRIYLQHYVWYPYECKKLGCSSMRQLFAQRPAILVEDRSYNFHVWVT